MFELPVVGGCGVGVISATAASASGYECGVLLFPATLIPTAILSAEVWIGMKRRSVGGSVRSCAP